MATDTVFAFVTLGYGRCEQDSQMQWQLESDEDHERPLKAEKNTEKVILKRKLNYDNITREVRTASCWAKKCIQSILTISDILMVVCSF